jgi:chaperonin GroES
MNFQPLGDRVIIKPLEAESKTKGGIVLPDTVKEKPQEGKVIAVGKGKVLENGTVNKPEVKEGDTVLYGKYSGTEVTSKDGEEYLIVREEDILAIVKKQA